MKKLKLFYLKNEMLVANGIANFIGVLLGKGFDERPKAVSERVFGISYRPLD